MMIDKYFHLYGRKNDVVFEEIPKPEERPHGEWKTESAIDYLTEIGWLPEHDRILTETRPHGEWIKHSTYKDVLICSKCNHGSNQFYDTFKFCPNCGARMGGEDK